MAILNRTSQALAALALLTWSLACGGGGSGASIPAPTISSFTPGNATITTGSSTTLVAMFSGGTASIDQGLGPVTSGVPVTTGALSSSTTFNLTVTNSDSVSVTAATTIAVVAAPVITSFSNNGPVTTGSPALLTAVFSDGTGVVTPGNLAITSGVPVSTPTLASSTPYTLTVTNAAGTSVTAMTTAVASSAMNTLNLTVNAPAGVDGLIKVFGPGGFNVVASSTETLPGLASGTYTLVPSGLWGSGAQAGQVFQASGGLAVPMTAGLGVDATVTYVSVPSLTLTLADTSNPGATVPLSLVAIAPGSFLMGAYTGEQDSNADELPQHSVALSQTFYIAEFVTTQAQWKAVMGSNPAVFATANGGAGTDDFSRPVENVSWDQITRAGGFLAQLNAVTAATRPTGMTFRLPTESEWEYACRGNTGTRFYWGDDPDYTILNQYAWCSGNSSGSTQPVGALQVGSANPFGLFDLSGNVFEWCQDWYGPYIAQSQTDPGGAASGPGRVVRGGAWCFANTYCRTANRSYSGIDDHFSSIGFRVVLASN